MPATIEKEALTFDDVLLVPSYSEVLPRETEIKTRLTPKIGLNLPILSAAMDTVTESELAVAIAREGGLGVIHRNLPLEAQALEVEKVKRSESGVIVDPITLPPEQKISKALEYMKRFSISGIPITSQGKLVGILTNRDVRFVEDLDQRIAEIMTKDNLITASEGITLEQAKGLLHRHRIEKLPVVDEEMNLKGMITVKDIMKKIQYPNAAKDKRGRLLVGAAVGVGEDCIDRASALVKAGVDLLVVDVSHGHSQGVLQATTKLKERFPDTELVSGNVATPQGAQALIEAGADGVKVGVGPGSICTTRIIAGAGVPQLTAIMDCASVCAEHDCPLIADGGIRYSGDITKALAAGADAVMIGGLFAGTQESPGETVLFEGRTFKVYRGMGSVEALKVGSGDRYHHEIKESDKLVPEGVEGQVPYRGPLSESIFQLVGGLRSGMGICGAKNLAELRRKAKFLRITDAGRRESHPHGVTITKEAPNYRINH
jgi:IMP dehydrogenase